MISVSKLSSSDAARCQSHFTVWLLLIHICPEIKFVSLSWSCLPASASPECSESTLSSKKPQYVFSLFEKFQLNFRIRLIFVMIYWSTTEFPPSRRTKSRISYREHTELVDESISPEGISTKTIPAVGEVLKLDLLLTVSCRCLNKNRYDTLLGCLEKIDIMDIR